LQAKLAYDPVRSFNAITMLVTLPNVLAVKAESPYRTLTDVVAAARQAPGKMNYASLGIGTTSHLSGEALKAAAGIDVAHVPYSGAGTALTSVMRGDTDYYFDTMFAAVPQVKANRLRILAVTSSRRAPSMPDIPTIIEAGVPKVDVTAWIAVFVPAGVPADIQKRLMQAFNTAKGVPEIRKRIIELGGEPSDTDASGVRQMIEIEGERFGKLVKHANIQAE
jgi:tripartite-type tricarboxylate transporter receptor subunit TctC